MAKFLRHRAGYPALRFMVRGCQFLARHTAEMWQDGFVRTVIYPGSFDPVTNGHLDVMQRAAKLFDRVVVAVAKNEGKRPLFTFKERVKLVKQSIGHVPN